MKYVMYLQQGDLMAGTSISQSFKIAQSLDTSRKRFSINEIIELYNITRYIESGAYLTSWSNQEKEAFKNSLPALHSIITTYFNNISKDNLLRIAKQVDRQYHSDFLALFVKKKLTDRISERQFISVIKKSGIHLRHILHYKSLVDTYGASIESLLLSNPRNAELLIDKYVKRNERLEYELNLPSTLDQTKKESLVLEYIDSEEANPNYLKLIANAHKAQGLHLSPATKVKAKRGNAKQEDEMFQSSNSFSTEYIVRIVADQDEAIIANDSGAKIERLISQSWLDDNSDYATILQNFIHLFEFTDDNSRIFLANSYAEMGIVDRFFGIKAKRDYEIGVGFHSKEQISIMVLHGIQIYLKRTDKSLEKAIEWFFSDYLKEEFKVEGFSVKLPSENASYREKCAAIFPEMEGMLKQFNLLVTDGEIDHDLIEASSDTFDYHQTKSLLSNKYAYINPDSELSTIITLLFSDQSGLTYISDDLQASNLFSLIVKNDIPLKLIPDYNQEKIKFLIQKKVLKTKNGLLKFSSTDELLLLILLNVFPFVEYQNLKEGVKQVVDKYVKKKYLQYGNSLLSKTEAQYFNYYLNRVEFDNGLNLRNNYAHGSKPAKKEESEYIYHYNIGLMLFVLLVIKINDEFCNKAE